MALELRPQLCTFENSTNCYEMSLDPYSFSEWLKCLFSTTCVNSLLCLVTHEFHQKSIFVFIVTFLPMRYC